MAIAPIGSSASGITRGLANAQQAGHPFSQALATAAANSPTSAAGGATQATPQQQYNQSLTDLQKTLAGLFSSAGIDTSQPIAIEQSPEGNLTVSNARPDTDQIEQILAAHPELGAKFSNLAANLRVYQQSTGNKNLPDPSSASLIVTLVGSQATANLA